MKENDRFPMFDLLNMEFSYDNENSLGFIECELNEYMLNPLGIVHGGIYSYIADTAFGLLMQHIKESPHVTLELKTSFMKSIREGRLFAKAFLVKDGSKVCFLECTIENEDKEILSVTTGTFLNLG